MKINGNSIKPGNIIEHQGKLWRAVKTMHTQPGKGGAYLQVELKDIRTGTCAWTSTNTSICSRTATTTPSWSRRPTSRSRSMPS